MATDRSLELRVSRLENDTLSIYDLLTKLTVGQDEHTRRLDGIDAALGEHGRRFDRIDSALVEVLRRLPER